MQAKQTQRRLLTVKEAAEFLCVSPRTVASLKKSGELPEVKLKRAVRFDIADLEEFIRRCKNG
ncbi:helix-turn-helix domain-containing protein [Sedimentisphaera salicampi]|uniref:helix-turn-helix domain-containing protein n=1 Tax=Sedimentisphaera salicampi TaxID=1941349 RepID=UPI000B9A6ABC|nr:helix-turn-helix domain-containing protein [Sedimentisphaera salicampi]OXU15403.1 DNA binding domain, excisionase family [Sedimentisphaera salicampi]